MNFTLKTWLNRLANVGLGSALILCMLPIGMRAYGKWTQAEAKRDFGKTASVSANQKPLKVTSTAMMPPLKSTPRQKWETSVLQIPAIGVDAVVTEGAGQWELTIGPGHVPQSAGPGGAGNCIIGAHRNMWDSAFADLPKLKRGDLVNLITSSGRYTYQVDRSYEVRTRDKSPLQGAKDARITLITCVLPFDKGRRWVTQGRLVDARQM